MRSDRSGQRLTCPHCRANNFVGQAQCWQCCGSLPPPEEIESEKRKQTYTAGQQGLRSALPVPPPPAYALSAEPEGQGGHSKMPLVLCIALLTAGTLVWIGTRRTGLSAMPSTQISRESAEMKELRAAGQGVTPESELPNSGLPDPGGPRLSVPERDPLPSGSDPTEMAAKRAIEHAIPRLGLPPGTAPDGKVHLRNGDTISSEQYEDVQRKLQHNPIFGDHPPVPRL